MARAVLGPGDLPLLVRAERVALSLTRQSVAITCEVLAMHLERIDEMIAEAANQRYYYHGDPIADVRTGLAADRIAVIDALAELRGER